MKHKYVVQGAVGDGSNKGESVYVTDVGGWTAWGPRRKAIVFDTYFEAIMAQRETHGPCFREPAPNSVKILEEWS